MRTPHSSLPDLDVLTRRLNAILPSSGLEGAPIEIVRRGRTRLMSTFPVETVVCRMGDGTLLRLFLKYQLDAGRPENGHRRGVLHEAEVYRRVLGSREDSRPKFYGTYADEQSGEVFLALENIRRGTQIREIRPRERGPSQEDAMILAARWIGRFHADLEKPAAEGAFEFLPRYDEGYYTGWARRTEAFTSGIQATRPWLPELCARAGPLLAPLMKVPFTVIHGEFYTNNILLRRRSIHVVDWEAAALGPGAIDLAALTEGWRSGLVQDCEAEYRATRWPNGAPGDFERTLEAARLYLHFRWLGERADRAVSAHRVERLRAMAARHGLVEPDLPAAEGPGASAH
jgi:aminoglycoside phosphotransferase (APT) family kinase protein